MRQLAHRMALAGTALACLGWAATAAAQTDVNQGAVVQSVPPPVSQKVSPPPLHLSDAQRYSDCKHLFRGAAQRSIKV